MKHKDEAFASFVEWSVMIENQAERKIKILRTDNGLELCNQRFNDFCKEKGIVRHMTCAYTPQQNGVVERMNRTIMEKVRSMLSHSGLPRVFWAEATHTAVTLINKTPSSAINFKIPDKKWSGKAPVYSYLRRFGCVCFVHSDDGKLMSRAKKGVLLGYPPGVKGYKTWLIEEKKCMISRNVIFQDNAVYKDVKKRGKEIQTDEEPTDAFLDLDLSESSDMTLGREMTLGGDHSEETVSLDDHQISQDGQQSEEEFTSTNLQQDSETTDVDSPESYHLARDRTRRNIMAPRRFDVEGYFGEETDDEEDFFDAEALITTVEGDPREPADYTKALRDEDWEFWKGGMGEEMDSLNKNFTWTTVTRPKGQRVIGCKWIYKRKPGIPGVETTKVQMQTSCQRLCTKGGGRLHRDLCTCGSSCVYKDTAC